MVHHSDHGFEWDGTKDQQNVRKHNVSFDEAKTVFLDPHARLIADPDHSKAEDRYVLVGMSMTLRLLVVCHCYRRNDAVIRIISARKAARKETLFYKEHLP